MNTVDAQEIQNFSKDSAHWWDPDGPFKPLHKLNPVRIQYIRDQICARYNLDFKDLKPFKDLKILDIGCGGGLVCEPMARLGADVTGIDADENAIEVAKDHAQEAGLSITYETKTAEQLLSFLRKQESSSQKKTDPRFRGEDEFGFDIVLALEVVEHVSDIDAFIKNALMLFKPGGLIIFSTLNRTAKSYALGIIAAEYLLRWVPRGTHNWKKFIRPSELARAIRQNDGKAADITGLIYNPLKGEFSLSRTDLDVNYFITALKD